MTDFLVVYLSGPPCPVACSRACYTLAVLSSLFFGAMFALTMRRILVEEQGRPLR